MVKTEKNQSRTKQNNSERQIVSVLLGDLKMMQQYIQAFWSFLPVPVCDINDSFIIISAGQKFFDFFGYREEEIIGQSIEKLFANPPEFQTFKRKLLKEDTLSNEEATLVSKQKKVIPVFLFGKARKEGEEIVSYFVAFIDLREIKEKEKTLKEKIEELENFHKLAVGRELKMIELKEEIEKLKEELEKYKGRK